MGRRAKVQFTIQNNHKGVELDVLHYWKESERVCTSKYP